MADDMRSDNTDPTELLGVADDELLLRAFARALPHSTVRSALTDRRFVEWERATLMHRDATPSDAEFMARGEELMARALGRQLRVACTSHPIVQATPHDRSVGLVDLGVAAGVGRDLADEPFEHWIELPEDLPDGRWLALRIVGDSMTPLVRSGDSVLVRLGPEVQSNTVIVARRPDHGYVCKKVERVTRTQIRLASLAPGYESFTIPRDPALIVGTVVMAWRQ